MPDCQEVREENVRLTISRNRFRTAYYTSVVVVLLLACSNVLLAIAVGK